MSQVVVALTAAALAGPPAPRHASPMPPLPPVHRRDRRPAPRPPLKPTLRVASIGVLDDYTRALAAALVDRYDPGTAWQWACEVVVLPGCVAGAQPTITLRFQRHEPSGMPDILDDYAFSWREMIAEPAAPATSAQDVSRYAAMIHEHVGELLRTAVLDHAVAWSHEHPGEFQGPNPF